MTCGTITALNPQTLSSVWKHERQKTERRCQTDEEELSGRRGFERDQRRRLNKEHRRRTNATWERSHEYTWVCLCLTSSASVITSAGTPPPDSTAASSLAAGRPWSWFWSWGDAGYKQTGRIRLYNPNLKSSVEYKWLFSPLTLWRLRYFLLFLVHLVSL